MKAVNPSGPDKNKCRVVRGGSWDNDDRYLQTTIRYYFSSAYKRYDIGFRVVCNGRKV